MNKIISLWILISLFATSNADEIISLNEVSTLVKFSRDPHYSSQYYIESIQPIAHICDIDLTSHEGKKLAAAIVLQCIELSKQNSDADFTLYISCKKDRIVITLYLYPRSTVYAPATCDFCDRKKFGGDIIAENNTTIAFEKSRPARNPINFLIVPKKHVVNYKDKNFKVETFINQLAIAQELSKKLTDNRVDLYINNGPSAAQSVFHSHMHFHSPAQWK